MIRSVVLDYSASSEEWIFATLRVASMGWPSLQSHGTLYVCDGHVPKQCPCTKGIGSPKDRAVVKSICNLSSGFGVHGLVDGSSLEPPSRLSVPLVVLSSHPLLRWDRCIFVGKLTPSRGPC